MGGDQRAGAAELAHQLAPLGHLGVELGGAFGGAGVGVWRSRSMYFIGVPPQASVRALSPYTMTSCCLARFDSFDGTFPKIFGRPPERWPATRELAVTTGDVVPGGMVWVVHGEVSPPSEAVGLPQLTSHKEGSWLTLEASTRTRVLTPQGRRRMVACVLDQGWTIEATAERFQVDAKTVRKWRDRFVAEGADGLMDRSVAAAPLTEPRPAPAVRNGCCSCAPASLGRDHIAHEVGLAASTVQAILRAEGSADWTAATGPLR